MILEFEFLIFINFILKGPHFRNGVLLHYFFIELKKEKIQLSFNFFAECHGKNDLDQHFSRISIFIRSVNAKLQIKSTKDIIHHVQDQQKKSNEWRVSQNKNKINLFAIEIRHGDEINKLQFGLYVVNVKNFYNFNNNNRNFEFRSSIFSDLKISKKIEFKIELEKTKTVITKIEETEKEIENVVTQFPKMVKKFLEIDQLLSETKNVFCTELCSRCSELPLLIGESSNKLKVNVIRLELEKHKHALRIYVNEKLKLKSKKEAFLELKIHYEMYHTKNNNSTDLSLSVNVDEDNDYESEDDNDYEDDENGDK
jgi:hypothetical protein